MDELLKLLSNVPTSVALQFLMGLTAVIVSINAVVIKLFNSLEKWRKKKNEEEERAALIASITELKEGLEFLSNGVKMILADKLNQRCHHYTEIKYIPEDEWEEFYKEHEAYNDLKGNSTIDAKFNKVVSTLPIK